MKRLTLSFLILTFLSLSGCSSSEYNVVTGRQDIIFISTEKEIELGRRIAEGLERNPDIVMDPDPLMTKRVSEIGSKIAAVAERQEVNYTFRVIDKDEVNAFALPGGYVYVFKGLVERVDSDDELACVLAHEVAHIVARHSVKRYQGGIGLNILQILMAVTGANAQESRKIDAALGQLVMAYSREDEALADKIALRYVKEAGYNPAAMIDFLETLREVHRKSPTRPYSSYRSHPHIADRIRMVKKELTGEIDYTDYMNKPVD